MMSTTVLASVRSVARMRSLTCDSRSAWSRFTSRESPFSSCRTRAARASKAVARAGSLPSPARMASNSPRASRSYSAQRVAERVEPAGGAANRPSSSRAYGAVAASTRLPSSTFSRTSTGKCARARGRYASRVARSMSRASRARDASQSFTSSSAAMRVRGR